MSMTEPKREPFHAGSFFSDSGQGWEAQFIVDEYDDDSIEYIVLMMILMATGRLWRLVSLYTIL